MNDYGKGHLFNRNATLHLDYMYMPKAGFYHVSAEKTYENTLTKHTHAHVASNVKAFLGYEYLVAEPDGGTQRD